MLRCSRDMIRTWVTLTENIAAERSGISLGDVHTDIRGCMLRRRPRSRVIHIEIRTARYIHARLRHLHPKVSRTVLRREACISCAHIEIGTTR